MGKAGINDCGTAHESKLLEIYGDLVKIEKERTGKDVTPLEKSKIEYGVVEAYQTILKVLNDGDSISRALNLLGKRIITNQISVNQISEFAIDVARHVDESKYTNSNFDTGVKRENNQDLGGITNNDNGNAMLLQSIQKNYGLGSPKEDNIINRAHSDDATQHDKDMYGALLQIDLASFEERVGIKSEDLSDSDKGFKIKTMKALMEEGDFKSAEAFKKQYDITDEELKDPLWDNWVFEDNTIDEEDAKISREIATFSDSGESYFKTYAKRSPEENQSIFKKEILENYEKSENKIDLGLEMLSRVARWNKNAIQTPEIQEFIDMFIHDIGEQGNTFEIDQYMTVRMIDFVNKLRESNPEGAKHIVDEFNRRAEEIGYSKFDFKKICDLSKEDIDLLYEKEREQKLERGQDAYEKTCELIETGKIKTIANEGKKIDEGFDKKIPFTNLSDTSKEKRYKGMMGSLNNAYKKDGMQAVMKCMQNCCSDSQNISENQKDWIKVFSKFLNVEENEILGGELKQEDINIITSSIKNVMLENGNNVQPNTATYDFIQVANEVIKGQNKDKKQILSANETEVKTVIEEFGKGKKVFGNADEEPEK